MPDGIKRCFVLEHAPSTVTSMQAFDA